MKIFSFRYYFILNIILHGDFIFKIFFVKNNNF